MRPVRTPAGADRLRFLVLASALLVSAACDADHGSTPSDVPVASVEFLNGEEVMAVFSEQSLQVRLRSAGGSPLSGRPIAWRSSDEAVATVSATGLVSARAEGVATIHATSGSARGELSLTVLRALAPTLESIAPTSVTAFTGDFTLTLRGSGFNSKSWVRINNAILDPEFVSDTVLRVRVGGHHIVAPGEFSIGVTNPYHRGGTSERLTLTVLRHPDARPAPVLTALSRDTVYVGSGAQTLILTGRGFHPSTVAFVGGGERRTTVLNDSTLEMHLIAEDVAQSRNHYVSVQTPGPGGGSHGFLVLAVRHAPTQ